MRVDDDTIEMPLHSHPCSHPPTSPIHTRSKHIDFDSPAWTHCLVATSVFVSMSFYKSQWRYFGFFIPLSIIHIENESIHWRISNVSRFFCLLHFLHAHILVVFFIWRSLDRIKVKRTKKGTLLSTK